MKALGGQLGASKSFWGGIDGEITLAFGDEAMVDHAMAAAVGALNEHDGLITADFDADEAVDLAVLSNWARFSLEFSCRHMAQEV